MVNRELVRKWVDALRSGKYGQTQNRLRDAKGYCCLGVLCDVAGAVWSFDEDDENYILEYSDGSCYDADLPPEIAEKVGLNPEPTVIEKNETESRNVSVISLNDIYEYTFEQIANLVESTYLN